MIEDVSLLEQKHQQVSYGQQGEDLVLNRILRRMLKLPNDYLGFYLDIGAYHPVRHSITYFLYQMGWSGICLDINEHSCELFKRIRTRDITICAAAGDREGEVVAYFAPGQISLTNTCDKNVAAKMIDKGIDICERHVPIITLDTMLEQYAPEKVIDFVNIDVEGLEMEVLKGFDLDKHKPKVVAMEIHAKSMDEALNTQVASYLRDNGYRPVGCCVITYFFVRNP